MSRTGADEQGHQDNTELSRLNDSLRQGICPYEDVAFYLAPLCGVALNFISGELAGVNQAVQVARFECNFATIDAGNTQTMHTYIYISCL